MNKTIKTIKQSEFGKYGYIIQHDSNNSDNFQVILNENEATGWRIAVSKVTSRNISTFGKHPNSMESFEPVEGTTLIYVANSESPEDYEIFLLDKPVCLFKNIWHATCCLSEYSIVKITENLRVESQEYKLR